MTPKQETSDWMFSLVQSVLFAAYHEHLRATGHDGFDVRHRLSFDGIRCKVCLFLGAAKRDIDQLEAESLGDE